MNNNTGIDRNKKTDFLSSSSTMLLDNEVPSPYQPIDPERKDLFSESKSRIKEGSSPRETEKTSKINVKALWNNHKDKIINVAFNALAFFASPVVYAISFTAGLIMNATTAKKHAKKISTFIENCKNYGKSEYSFSRDNEQRTVVMGLVGLLAVGFTPARWAFSGAVAFDAGRAVQQKASQWLTEFREKARNKSEESSSEHFKKVEETLVEEETF